MAQLEEVRPQLVPFCRHSLYDRGSLEDVLQTVVLMAYERFDDFRHGTSFHAWIFRIAANVVLNTNRRHRRESERMADLDVEELDLVAELQREYAYDELLRDPGRVLDHVGDELLVAIGELSERERNVFLLKSICELPCREIADLLQMPVGSVMGYLARARGKLRSGLAEYAKHRGFISGVIREESSNGLPNG
ncbi:MAG: RNA polymerase sigma factor [Candidatus Zixiibacteriota bacterium]